MHAAQINPEEPEGFALQRVDHFGLRAVELNPQGFQLLLQTLQGTSMTVVILRIRLRLTSARARCGDRLGRNP